MARIQSLWWASATSPRHVGIELVQNWSSKNAKMCSKGARDIDGSFTCWAIPPSQEQSLLHIICPRPDRKTPYLALLSQFIPDIHIFDLCFSWNILRDKYFWTRRVWLNMPTASTSWVGPCHPCWRLGLGLKLPDSATVSCKHLWSELANRSSHFCLFAAQKKIFFLNFLDEGASQKHLKLSHESLTPPEAGISSLSFANGDHHSVHLAWTQTFSLSQEIGLIYCCKLNT